MDSRGMQSFQDTGEDSLAMTDAAVQPDVEPCMLVIFGGAGDLARAASSSLHFSNWRVPVICRRHYESSESGSRRWATRSIEPCSARHRKMMPTGPVSPSAFPGFRGIFCRRRPTSGCPRSSTGPVSGISRGPMVRDYAHRGGLGGGIVRSAGLLSCRRRGTCGRGPPTGKKRPSLARAGRQRGRLQAVRRPHFQEEEAMTRSA